MEQILIQEHFRGKKQFDAILTLARIHQSTQAFPSTVAKFLSAVVSMLKAQKELARQLQQLLIAEDENIENETMSEMMQKRKEIRGREMDERFQTC